MAVFKCKMCGGALEVGAGKGVITCEFCGTTQTLPRLDDERRANLYDRANHYRRNNDYDKAMREFEKILDEDKTDFEAYWSIVLCRYGIEYVKDPQTGKYMPTINRMQKASVIADADYKAAIEYADDIQKQVLVAEANAILAIQKEIAVIVRDEKPFDIFICYKETDAAGRRSRDSVLAQELYGQLTNEGFKVFFARITLEDKLGSAYEPYIFSALNSSKVMVVIGTCAEHFNAVWVKNEWSRYLALIQNGEKKVLIPAYKDMDPYDMPEEFSHLQAQDMDKLGFMQDLVRGINKIIGKEKSKPAAVASSGNATVDSLLRRVMMFLEDSDWEKANEYCEKILDIDPENAQAYLAKLCVDLKKTSFDKIPEYHLPVSEHPLYKKALRFASGDFADTVRSCDNTALLNEKRNKKLQIANEFLNQGKFGQAAVWYQRAGEFGKARELCDFSTMITGCEDGYIAFATDGRYYYSKGCVSVAELPYAKYKMAAFNKSDVLALLKNGTVFSTEYKSVNEKWKGIKKICRADSISTGIIVGLKNNGRLFIEGDKQKALAAFTEENDVVDVHTLSYDDLVILKSDGSVISTYHSKENKSFHMENICFVSVCNLDIAAIRSDGTVVTTRDDVDVSDLKNIVYVCMGESEVFAVDDSGKVLYRGGNKARESVVRNWTDIAAVYLTKQGVVGLLQDGQIISSFDNSGFNLFADVSAEDDAAEEFVPPSITVNKRSSVMLRMILDSVNGGEISWKNSESYAPLSGGPDQNRSTIYTMLEKIQKQKGECEKYIVSELTKRGFQNACVLIEESRGPSFSTPGDKSSYESDTAHYEKVKYDYDYPADYRNSLKRPVLKQSGVTYILTLTVETGEKGIALLQQKEKKAQASKVSESKSKSSSGGISYTTKRKIKKFIKWIITLAVLAVAATIVISMLSSGKNEEEDATKPIDVSVSEIYTEPTEYYIMSSDYTSINIRTQANSDCSVLTKVTSRETKLVPTGETSGKWIQITVNGETGWVHNSVVEYVD